MTQITRKCPKLIPLYRIGQIDDFADTLHAVSLTLSDDNSTVFLSGENIDFLLEEYANREVLTYTDRPDNEFIDNLIKYWALKQAQYTAAWLAYTAEYDPLNNYDLHESGSGTGTRTNTGTQTTTNTGTQSIQGTESKSNTGTQTIADTGTQTTNDTGTQTTANTGTVTDAGTNSGTTTNTVSANDSTAWENHDKSESSGTTGNTRTDNTQEQRTDALQSQRTDNLQSQRTDNLTESGTNNSTRTDNLTNARTDDLSEETAESHTLRRYGNIGVTSSQQLLESELSLRLRHTLNERFIFEFLAAFTV